MEEVAPEGLPGGSARRWEDEREMRDMMRKILKAIGMLAICCIAPIPVLGYFGVCAILDVRRFMGDRIERHCLHGRDVIDAEVVEID